MRGRLGLKNAFAGDAFLGLDGRPRRPVSVTDGPGQVPLTRTVGDEAEAEAAANRDDVRRMYWKQHVEPRILTASQRTRRGA